VETHRLSHQPWKSVHPFDCGGEQENNMKGKERNGLASELQAMHKKSQKCYISRSCGAGTPSAISMKFVPLVHVVNIINFAKCDHCNSIGLDLARV
jgi:hypothetical protein